MLSYNILMRKVSAVLLTILFLSAYASATVSVQELYDQSLQNKAAIEELKAAFKDFKTAVVDQINLIGMKNVGAFILAYISLSCFAHLFRIWWGYRNKKKYMRERDRFLENLKRENALVKERIELVEKEGKLMRENFYLFNEMLNKKLPKDNSGQYRKLLKAGAVVALAGLGLAYRQFPGAEFVIGFSIPLIIIGLLSNNILGKKEELNAGG